MKTEEQTTPTTYPDRITNNLKNSFVSAAIFLALAGTAVPLAAAPIKNIVLVHGAFVDGSGWRPVYDVLVKDERCGAGRLHQISVDDGRSPGRR
jgi:hypothetical protein